MPSLMSSVGSNRSTDHTRNLHLSSSNDDSSEVLRSSWIRRLRLPGSAAPPHFHPQLPPPQQPPLCPASSSYPNLNSISTGESRTRASISTLRSAFARCLPNSFVPSAASAGGRLSAGFGPYRLSPATEFLLFADQHEPHRRSGGAAGFRIGGKDASAVDCRSNTSVWNSRRQGAESREAGFRSRIVSSLIQVKKEAPVLAEEGLKWRGRELDSRWRELDFKFENCNENNRGASSSSSLWRVKESSHNGHEHNKSTTEGGIRGFGFMNAACADFSDRSFIHHTAPTPYKQEKQALPCPREQDDDFSYWNMGRCKRIKTNSSAYPAFAPNRRSEQQLDRHG